MSGGGRMALSPSVWSFEETGLSYAEWLKAKNTQTRAGGWTHATHDQAREYVGKDGRRVKDVTDQLGNRIVQHGRDQQSVHIKSPETVHAVIHRSPQKKEVGDVG